MINKLISGSQRGEWILSKKSLCRRCGNHLSAFISSHRHVIVIWECVGMVSLSMHLKKRKDKRKHDIPTCPFKGKFFNWPHFKVLRPLFISLKLQLYSWMSFISSALFDCTGDFPKLHVVPLHLFCLLVWSTCALRFARERSRRIPGSFCQFKCQAESLPSPPNLSG